MGTSEDFSEVGPALILAIGGTIGEVVGEAIPVGSMKGLEGLDGLESPLKGQGFVIQNLNCLDFMKEHFHICAISCN